MNEDGRRGSGRVLAPTPRSRVERLDAPPTFSVVIAAYQAAETVAGAARSALSQTHPAHEVIVVDDGSTDDIRGALRPFEDEIELIKKSNGGVASARNVGLEAAKGDFVAPLDADDRFHPRRIEAMAELSCLRPDLDLVSTDMRFIVDGKEAGRFLDDNTFAIEDQRTAILSSCFVGGLPAVRSDRLRGIGGFDESLRIASDWDCWLRLILDGSEAGLVDRPYYDYVLHPGTLTSSRARSLWGRVRLLEKAAVNPGLRAEELPHLKRELRRRRSEAVVEEAQAPQGGERRRLARLAVRPGLELRARVVVALALPFPALARRLVHSRRPPAERFSAEDQ